MDLKADGGYVVGAGALHANGKWYEPLDPDKPIAVMSPALVKLLRGDLKGELDRLAGKPVEIANGAPKSNTILAAASNISTAPPFLPVEVERLSIALNRISPCSRDTWRDVGTGMRWLRRHGWDDDVLFDIFDRWSANCRGVGAKGPRYDPATQQAQWKSFDNKDIDGPLTIASVYAMAVDGAGCGCLCADKVPEPPSGRVTAPVPATMAPKVILPPEDDQLGCHNIPSFADIPPRATLYGDYLIRKLISVVVGPAGSGKSILSIAEALAMATGKPLSKSHRRTLCGFSIGMARMILRS